MSIKTKKIQRIFIIYWVMLAYIIAALIWWFIALDRQNSEMIGYMYSSIEKTDADYADKVKSIENFRKRKHAQYLGEGLTFLLLIIGFAVFVFRAARNQLRLSNERQTFMMAVTHELKTPIAVSRLNLETILKRKLEEPIRQKFLQNTLDEIHRMNALCSNLLMSSQLEGGKVFFTPESLNLTTLINECVQETRFRFPGRNIETNIESDVLFMGDRFQLQIVINNLLDNAIKYSKENIIVDLHCERNQITISIKDYGPGISETDKQKIFEKFYRAGNEATRSSRGTGLGLYLIKQIVQKHGGSISVKDNHPSGSIFIIYLPII